MARFIIVPMLLSLPAFAGVTDDARLAAVKAQVDQAYAAAARDSVPAALLDDKLAEGLAKNVPPARLAAFIGDYEARLAQAAALAGAASTPPMLKAIVEARAAGATNHDLEPLLARGAHTVDVLTDLAQRGFPPSQVAGIVAKVAEKTPRQLDRLAAVAQSLAARVGRMEALDAIARAADRGLGPDRAPDFVGKSDDRGPNRDDSGQRGPGYQHGKGKP